MRKTLLPLILMSTFTGLFMAGCSDSSGPVSIMQVEAAELIATQWNESDPVSEAVALSANDFAFRLSSVFLEDVAHDNFAFSPYSIWMPLAALLNATNDANKPAFSV